MSKRRVLVVEDEMMVVLYLEDVLQSLGHTVAATAGRLEEAVKLAEEADIDFALLDLNLAGARTYPVAAALQKRAIPFAFATGYGSGGIAAEYAHIPTLTKPFRVEDIATVLDRP
jgi:CheY-like chemotaxis protein